ncbi:hypothetical protein HOY80DRAFT_890523, partial [Tuber brumale]
RPVNKEELCNLCHTLLRNAIECILGILKKQFLCLSAISNTLFKSQVKLVFALIALRNYIQWSTIDKEEDEFYTISDEDILQLETEKAGTWDKHQRIRESDNIDSTELAESIELDEVEDSDIRKFCDQMAEEIWVSDIQELKTRFTRLQVGR